MKTLPFVAAFTLAIICCGGETLAAATQPPGTVVTLPSGKKCKVLGSSLGGVIGIGGGVTIQGAPGGGVTLRETTLRGANALLEVLETLKTSDPQAYISVVKAFNDVPASQRSIITEDLGLEIGESEIAVSAPLINSYRLQKGLGLFEDLQLRQLDKVYSPAQ